MKLGTFSISLSVKNIAASRAFYEALGFTVFAGDQSQRWLIMKNEATVIGLFEGVFEKNMLTFNPGWDGEAKPLPEFEDVRSLQQRLKAQGIVLDHEADATTQGPAYVMLKDPDGNPILIDQHV